MTTQTVELVKLPQRQSVVKEDKIEMVGCQVCGKFEKEMHLAVNGGAKLYCQEHAPEDSVACDTEITTY